MIKPNLPIILASTSPRRAELLALAGIPFSTVRVDIDETRQADESATDYIRRMVVAKAALACNQPDLGSDCLMITADTIGVLPDGEVLTKPIDKADAYRMWRLLSDGWHEIWTAVCVSRITDGQIANQKQLCVRTRVQFIPVTESMMADYWASGEPADKAGAYAIQGRAAAWVRAIAGSYTNVVGLPLAETTELLIAMSD